MERCRVIAWAKVNLTLEILGRRADGFHEVRSVMQSISIADELEVRLAPDLELEVSDEALSGPDNLVLRAAQLLRDSSGHRGGAAMRLGKGIPVAAGLGGASADAAAALVGLDRLWGLGSRREDLQSIAAALGSDVPFFVRGGTALAMGRGEVIQPLPDVARMWMVILVPRHALASKTAEMYRRLGTEQWTSGERSLALAEAIVRGAPVSEEMLVNAFEPVAEAAFPSLGPLRRAMIEAGAPSVHLSGAGPSIFSIFDAEASAIEVHSRLIRAGHRPLLARTLRAAEAQPIPGDGDG